MQHSWKKDIAIVLGTILLAAASLLMIGRLTVDSSTDAFMPKGAPVIKVNDRIESQFGSLDAIIVGLSVEEGSILNRETLALLESLTGSIAAMDAVNRVMSITNTEHITSGDEGFEVVPLYDPTEPDAIGMLEKRLGEWSQVYDGDLISTDRSMASMIIQSEAGLSQHEIDTLLDQVGKLLDEHATDGVRFSLIGLPLVKQQINRSLLSDMAILGPIVGLLIVLVLFFSFRRLAGIILPLVGLVISAAISLGIMAILDITFTMATMLVPVLLLIVGSAYAIHVMSHFYEEVAHLGRTVSAQQTFAIIDTVIHRNRMPIIMAGATTAAGFIAQFTSPLGPFRTFGLLSAVGVVLSQLSSLYLLPAMLRITYRHGIDPLRLHAERELKREFKGHPVFNLFERWSLTRRVPLVIISSVLFIVTIILLPTIETGTDMLKFFHRSTKLVSDTELYNQHMSGSGILTVMIDGNEESAVLDPAFLTTLERFTAQVESVEGVGKVQTVVPYLKRMNLIMNQDQEPYRSQTEPQADFDFFGDSFGFSFDEDSVPEDVTQQPESVWDPLTYEEIPTDPAKYGLATTDDLKGLLSQYLLLYGGNLGPMINDELEPSATLVTIQMRESGNSNTRAMRRTIESYWDEHLAEGWSYAIGGGEAISLALTDLVTKSQIYSLVGALVIVWLLVSLIFRSPIAGLLGLVPVVFALAAIFSAMALIGITLDVITSLLAALAIGIGVDYAIHFMAACRRQSCDKEGKGGLSAIMNTTGRAIVINAASVIIGFSGLVFSRFIPIRQMGILFCVSMVFSSLSSLTVLPMIITWAQPKFLTSERHRPEKDTSAADTSRRIYP